MIPAGKPPISLIALKFSTLFRQLQHHLWKSGETLAWEHARLFVLYQVCIGNFLYTVPLYVS